MSERAPHPGEFGEELSVSDLLPIGPMMRKGNADGVECRGPRAEVSQNGASLTRIGVPIEVATREAPTAKLFRDLAKLLHKDFTR